MGLAVFVRLRLACRGMRGRVFCLCGLEVASNTEVDQIDVSVHSQHHISGLEVAEDNGRLARMGVFDHHAKLAAYFKHFLNWQLAALDLAEMLFHGFAFDKVNSKLSTPYI